MFKKMALAALIGGISVSTSAVAQATNWGEVAGGSEVSPSTESTAQASASGAWGGDPAAPEVAQASSEAAKAEPGCGEDDSRYARLVPVLKNIQAGKELEPLQTSFSTYVGLNAKIRGILGDNIVISSPDCSEQFIFEGVLTGKVSVPFSEQWNVINDALRTGDQGLLRFIANNTKTAPASALTVISMAQYTPLDEGQLKQLYTVTAPEKAKEKELKAPLMLELFLQFGGTVEDKDQGATAYVGSVSPPYNGVDTIYLQKGLGKASHRLSGNEMPGRVASLLTAAGLNTTVMDVRNAKIAAEASAD